MLTVETGTGDSRSAGAPNHTHRTAITGGELVVVCNSANTLQREETQLSLEENDSPAITEMKKALRDFNADAV